MRAGDLRIDVLDGLRLHLSFSSVVLSLRVQSATLLFAIRDILLGPVWRVSKYTLGFQWC